MKEIETRETSANICKQSELTGECMLEECDLHVITQHISEPRQPQCRYEPRQAQCNSAQKGLIAPSTYFISICSCASILSLYARVHPFYLFMQVCIHFISICSCASIQSLYRGVHPKEHVKRQLWVGR